MSRDDAQEEIMTQNNVRSFVLTEDDPTDDAPELHSDDTAIHQIATEVVLTATQSVLPTSTIDTDHATNRMYPFIS